MNPEQERTFREQLEVRIVALLLGEASAFEAAELQEAMQKDPELVTFHKQTQGIISLVREASSQPNVNTQTASPQLKLSPDRRKKLLQQFKMIAPKELARQSRRKRRWYVPASIAAAVVVLLGISGLFFPSIFLKQAKSKSQSELLVLRTQSYRGLPTGGRPLGEQASQSIGVQGGSPPSTPPSAKGVEATRRFYLAESAAKSAPKTPGINLYLPASQAPPPQPQPKSEPSIAAGGVNFTLAPVLLKQWTDSAKGMAEPPPASPPPVQFSATDLAIAANQMPYDADTSGSVKAGDAAAARPSRSQRSADSLVRESGTVESHARTKLSALRESPRPATILGDTNRDARADAGAFYGGYAFKGEAVTRPAMPQAAQPQASTRQVTDGSAVNLLAEGKQLNEPAAVAGEPLGQIVAPRSVASSRGKAKSPESSRPATPSLGDVATLGREFRSRAGGPKPKAPAPSPAAPATVPPPAAPLARDAEGRTDARGLARQRLIADREELGRLETGKPALDDKSMKERVVNGAVEAARTVAGKPISASVVEGESGGRKTEAAESLGTPLAEQKPASVPPTQPEAKLERAQESEEDIAVKKAPATTPPTPQPEVSARDNAFSTFSLNVSDVSFKLAGASLENGALPDPASIRVEEFVNAFNYRDPAPSADARLAFAWERARYPFAHNRDVLRFSIQTAARGREPQKPLNLVILLDNSGSMERPDRVAILREALSVLARLLGPQDRLSVIAFARTARLWVDGLAGGDRDALLAKVLDLNPQGGTNLEDALDLGYATALRHFMAHGVNRLILLTDGAANLGNVEPEALKQKVVVHRQKGIALDCFGIGWEGYNDDLLEVLSHNGDGRYGFLNEPEQAAPEFADQLAGALNVAAADVKTQVEFNPSRVAVWRQIGYAKHQLTQEQFRDNTVDAAEIAAAESGNALYVIQVNSQGSGPIGVVRVRCKVPETGEYVEQAWPLPYQPAVPALDQASPALRLAVASAAFGEWLSRSPYAAEVNLNALQAYLAGVPEVFAPDPRPERLGWMIRQAQALAGK